MSQAFDWVQAMDTTLWMPFGQQHLTQAKNPIPLLSQAELDFHVDI